MMDPAQHKDRGQALHKSTNQSTSKSLEWSMLNTVGAAVYVVSSVRQVLETFAPLLPLLPLCHNQALKRFCKSVAEASQYVDLSDVTLPVDIQSTAVREWQRLCCGNA